MVGVRTAPRSGARRRLRLLALMAFRRRGFI